MKYEISDTIPHHFVPDWPGQYDIFSHFEFTCGIPQAVFAVTTRKDNGKPNVCPQTWSSFSGNKSGYYAILGGLSPESHTYRNILRERVFCVNFLSPSYYDAMMQSIRHNGDDDDEFAVCGFHTEEARTSSAPRIAEAFLTLECELAQRVEVPDSDGFSLLVGRVRQAAVEEAYARGIDQKYGAEGFFFNIHSPVDLPSGRCAPVGVATLEIRRTL